MTHTCWLRGGSNCFSVLHWIFLFFDEGVGGGRWWSLTDSNGLSIYSWSPLRKCLSQTSCAEHETTTNHRPVYYLIFPPSLFSSHFVFVLLRVLFYLKNFFCLMNTFSGGCISCGPSTMDLNILEYEETRLDNCIVAGWNNTKDRGVFKGSDPHFGSMINRNPEDLIARFGFLGNIFLELCATNETSVPVTHWVDLS